MQKLRSNSIRIKIDNLNCTIEGDNQSDLDKGLDAIGIWHKFIRVFEESPEIFNFSIELATDAMMAGAIKILKNNVRVAAGFSPQRGGRVPINFELEFNNWVNGLPSKWGTTSRSRLNLWVRSILDDHRDLNNLPVLHLNLSSFKK